MTLPAFFDIEVSQHSEKIHDIGCVLANDETFHSGNPNEFIRFVSTAAFIAGHNIFKHDLVYLQKYTGNPNWGTDRAIDTLLLAPLLFPERPYHKLTKDDKLDSEERNNPVNDSIKSKQLFSDEVQAFHNLPDAFKLVLYRLLSNQSGFSNFFRYLGYSPVTEALSTEQLIAQMFAGKLCNFSELAAFVVSYPVALAYTLALIHCNDRHSITPPWVLKNYPQVEKLLFLLCNNPCLKGCDYCSIALDPRVALRKYFHFDQFRSYGGKELQEDAINAAIMGRSILAVFPTGGGKSITFQVPALMSGDNAKALTVVISPLQSLMKDQVDNLEKKDITSAVTINGLLNPIERSKAIERIENGEASLLYISPESLRSVTIERLLLKRKIARFVIDEAHCFSSWGQDFRVDYLYIGDFIRNLREKKSLEDPIPVSCFTATAKQKVIEDIRAYFKEKLNLELELFTSNTSRTNLHYNVYKRDTEEDKYSQLRTIIEEKDCPAIVYVSRTKRAYKLAERLSADGFNAKPYHGKMDKEEKSENQNAFMSGEINIMVATSAFGMGVDKNDVGTVIHYDISDSLENYVQESGRAGRDENIEADCHVLFSEEDLDKHFILLNQTKISSKEINQVWKAIKELTKTRSKVSNSALEIARKAGWDDGIGEIETRVTTAIAALEDAGYLKRGQNMPKIFANSILSKNAREAIQTINQSTRFTEAQKAQATRIIKKLFSSKSKNLSTDEVAESRVDYISDQLGIVKGEVIRIIELMRDEKILAQARDLTAFIKRTETLNKSLAIFDNFRQQEVRLLEIIDEVQADYNLKEIIEQFIEAGIKDCSVTRLKTLMNFWAIKHWIKRHSLDQSRNHIHIALLTEKSIIREKLEKRHLLARHILEYLFRKTASLIAAGNTKEEILIEFSVLELKDAVKKEMGMFTSAVGIEEIEDCLFYLSRIEAVKVEGGFLVVHNKLTIDRLETNNRIQYKESDYDKLRQFYQQKVQQIHIVGEYAKKMIRNYNEALQFVDDYFQLNYSSFISKYFPGSRQDEIRRTLTPEKFIRLFGALSPAQLHIINDSANQHIVVAAGPGSGKTRVLVHKLASLLLAEDVKHEQLLMLTFSRAAATEFKLRLKELIGNAAAYVAIKTFHSYCFDLLGRVGNLDTARDIVKDAAAKIRSGEIETSGITKAVLVIDEAQDMSKSEYELVQALMEHNEEMRVILVGDDDQNIYSFRGSDAANMQRLINEKMAVKYELTENYRSKNNIVEFANLWAANISNRLKSDPGVATTSENGLINITSYTDDHLIVPVANAVKATDLSGSTCIITRSNEDAMLITGLLGQMGVQAKLIQSNESFSLSDLVELRQFSGLLNERVDSPQISDDDWAEAKERLQMLISKSDKKELVNEIIKVFEETNSVRKYKSDWSTFLFESKLEDFLKVDTETIYVSTIHKAKGKEFNNVFLMLKDFEPVNDEMKRQIYVAITRAKSNLSVHYNDDYFSGYPVPALIDKTDNHAYGEPRQIVFYLTHKDVWLGYFEKVKAPVQQLVAGSMLQVVDNGLANLEGRQVLRYSNDFQQKLAGYRNKGFEVKAAKVNYLVHWKNKDSGNESVVVLAKLLLKKQQDSL